MGVKRYDLFYWDFVTFQVSEQICRPMSQYNIDNL